MTQLFSKYRSIFRFVLLFIGTYVILSFSYGLYLSQSKPALSSDGITQMVASQSSFILRTLQYDAVIVPHETEPSLKLFVNDEYLAQIIEGCNSVSICILFISFVTAFAKRFRRTIGYLLFGVLVIYVMNLVRIVILTLALYYYPEYQESLHKIVFPAMIYGVVMLLWVRWIQIIYPKRHA